MKIKEIKDWDLIVPLAFFVIVMIATGLCIIGGITPIV